MGGRRTERAPFKSPGARVQAAWATGAGRCMHGPVRSLPDRWPRGAPSRATGGSVGVMHGHWHAWLATQRAATVVPSAQHDLNVGVVGFAAENGVPRCAHAVFSM